MLAWVALPVALAFCLAVQQARAQSLQAQRARAEATMLVKGDLVVAPTGRVRSYAIDHGDALPEAVRRVIADNVPRWQFKPVLVDGQPVAAKAQMSLRVLAQHVPGARDRYVLKIGSTYFGDGSGGTGITPAGQRAPEYPQEAVEGRVGGTVYLVIRVGRDGSVEKLAAEQVNLDVVGREGELERYRDVLARTCLRTAKGWSFKLSPKDLESGQQSWIVRVPVNFRLHRMGDFTSPFNHWNVSVPGPRALVRWLGVGELASGGVDALPPGQIAPGRQSLTLETAVKPG